MYPNQPNGYPPQQPPQPQQPQYPPQGSPPQYGPQPPAPQYEAGGYPQQAFPQQRSSGHNPYEFIVKNETRNGGSLFGGASVLQRVGIIGGVVVLLIIVIMLGVNAMMPKDNSTTALIAVAQRQAEIVRVATDGTTHASSQDVRNAVTDTALGITTSENQTLAYLQQHGTKLGTKQLALAHNAQTDTTLANALASSTYDTAVVQNLTTQLTTYQANLKTAFNRSKTPAAKTLLQKEFNAADLLLKQLKATQAATS